MTLNGDPREAGAAFAAVMAASLANGGSLDDIMPGIQYFADLKETGNLIRTDVTRGDGARRVRPRSCSTGRYNFPALQPTDGGRRLRRGGHVPDRRRVRLVLRPGRRRRQPAPERRQAVDRAHPVATTVRSATSQGGAIPARYEALVDTGTITDDMQTNLPPADLIAQISVPDRRPDRRRQPGADRQLGPDGRRRVSRYRHAESFGTTAGDRVRRCCRTGARPPAAGSGAAHAPGLAAWAGLLPFFAFLGLFLVVPTVPCSGRPSTKTARAVGAGDARGDR